MYKLKDIMEMMNIPERTIRRHIKLGILCGEKIGGTWRFSEDDLQKYFSTKPIQQSQKHLKINEILDYLNGLSKTDEQIIMIKQLKKISIRQNKDLSLFVSNFKHNFYFNLDTKIGKSVITFKGAQKDALLLLEKVASYDKNI